MRLYLFIPDLGGPEASTPTPALSWLLARAQTDQSTPASLEETLCRLFLQPSDTPFPYAPLALYGETNTRPEGQWLSASPVHLEPSYGSVLLTEADHLDIDAGEADALIKNLNQAFTGRCVFAAPAPSRFYLQLTRPFAGRTLLPLSQVVGRPIELLPHDNIALWALQTEIEMVLHQDPVNRAREERNQPTINGLWLWGEGVLPGEESFIDAKPFDRVYSANPLVAGLARITGIEHHPLPDSLADLTNDDDSDSRILVVEESLVEAARYGQTDEWNQRLQRFEDNWFLPLKQISSKKIAQLTVETLDRARHCRFLIERKRRWWSRK